MPNPVNSRGWFAVGFSKFKSRQASSIFRVSSFSGSWSWSRAISLPFSRWNASKSGCSCKIWGYLQNIFSNFSFPQLFDREKVTLALRPTLKKFTLLIEPDWILVTFCWPAITNRLATFCWWIHEAAVATCDFEAKKMVAVHFGLVDCFEFLNLNFKIQLNASLFESL